MITISGARLGHGFSEDILESLLEFLRFRVGPLGKVDILDPDEHSNDRLEVFFRDGRRLVVKRGRHPWAAERFEASRIAGDLLRERAGVIAPEHVTLPHDRSARALLAYWWIDRPTLRELWNDLPEEQMPEVMRSWGRLIRRVHDIRLSGYGPIPALETSHFGLGGFLHSDLAGRLLPAVVGEWREGAAAVKRLIRMIPEVTRRVRDDGAVLVHNDLHMANVLCSIEGDEVRCVGLLDLEAAGSGPPEADLASIDVLQGPCFFHPLPEECIEWIREGYGSAPDPFVVAFYRAYHLVNMGFYSNLVGYTEHADRIAEQARHETDRLRLKRAV